MKSRGAHLAQVFLGREQLARGAASSSSASPRRRVPAIASVERRAPPSADGAIWKSFSGVQPRKAGPPSSCSRSRYDRRCRPPPGRPPAAAAGARRAPAAHAAARAARLVGERAVRERGPSSSVETSEPAAEAPAPDPGAEAVEAAEAAEEIEVAAAAAAGRRGCWSAIEAFDDCHSRRSRWTGSTARPRRGPQRLARTTFDQSPRSMPASTSPTAASHSPSLSAPSSLSRRGSPCSAGGSGSHDVPIPRSSVSAAAAASSKPAAIGKASAPEAAAAPPTRHRRWHAR